MSAKAIGSAYATYLLNIFTAILANFVLLRLVADAVDSTTFALYAVVSQVSTLLAVLQMGLDTAVSTRIAEALGKGDTATAARVDRQLGVFCRRGGLSIAVLAAAAALIAPACLRVEGERSRLLAELIFLCGCSQAVSFVNRSSVAAIVGSQRLAHLNLLRIAQQVLAITVGYGCFLSGVGVASLPLGDLTGAIVSGFLLARLRRRHCPWRSTAVGDAWAGFGSLVRFGVVYSLSGVAGVFEYALDPLLLGLSRGGVAEAIAAYTLWSRLPMMWQAAASGWMNNAVPSMTAGYARDPVAGARLMRKVCLVNVAISTFGAVSLGVWLQPFVHHWLSGKYDLPQGRTLALWFGLAALARCLAHQYVTLALALAKPGAVSAFSWALTGAKLAIAVPLVMAMGIQGVVIAGFLGSCAAMAGLAIWTRYRIGPTGMLSSATFLAIPLAAGAVHIISPYTESLSLGSMIAGIAANAAAFLLLGLLAIRRFLRNRRAAVSVPRPETN